MDSLQAELGDEFGGADEEYPYDDGDQVRLQNEQETFEQNYDEQTGRLYYDEDDTPSVVLMSMGIMPGTQQQYLEELERKERAEADAQASQLKPKLKTKKQALKEYQASFDAGMAAAARRHERRERKNVVKSLLEQSGVLARAGYAMRQGKKYRP